MKKYSFLLSIIFLTFITGCGIKEVVNPMGEINNSSPDGKGEANTTHSTSYQPVSKGSTWVYNNSFIGGSSTQTTIHMTGGTTTFAGKTYYNASGSTPGQAASNGYFYNDSNIYIIRSTTPAVPGLAVNIQYLDTSLPVGGTWTNPATDSGTINDMPAQMVGTIMEIGITKTIGGKTFSDVIHTQIDLQYNFGTGFESFALYDYYIAKGIGIIEQDGKSLGVDLNKQTIVSYDIK